MSSSRIYMDWNATAPLLPEAREACLSALDLLGNPSSVHGEGRALRTLIENARRDVAALCGAKPGSVIFTSGATEAANLVLTPDFRMGRTPLKIGRLYASAIEHPAVREGGRFPREALSEIPVISDGVVDLPVLRELLSAHDRQLGLPMVAVMLVNNETGIIQPIAEITEIVRAHGGILVVDAVQAAGRVPLSIEDLGADFLIVSSHKIGGPKGAGALVARGEVMMPAPLIRGGGQEKGHRSGTENPVAIAGFAAAARKVGEDVGQRMGVVSALRDMLEGEMLAAATDVVIHGRDVSRVGNTIFFTLPGLKAETGQIAFDLEGVALSAGSACSSGKVGQSHVLTAMGYDPRQGALRISIGESTTQADIDRCAAVFAKVAARRRAPGQAA
ncbi:MULTISPECIES: cysteine desulfurase family protein [Ensifer]|uniref:cysteine desulfurase family protein n=1 Tax=Ensifer TaxID=106591 RepID=UPI000B5B5247|nr:MULTISPECIES: cysteine desulfurase family protein [Ensifer]OWZ92870.1 cysteine desulfurase [Sinorhizobium sp. LM21]MBD9623128.1 cysteine desulfurase [Ensifer sp. ENS06]MBW0370397.1 cysteine desulfurase [Ensifer adhaerens]RAS16164.1 cysteine desulfurase [Ensifer adhaerens]UCM21425.1 cysteine desulfurase [Ensifer adhaerens]